MSSKNMFQSKHFELHQLAEGVFAAIHKSGGAAYNNAGIIDLGDRALVIDAFDTALAARDLRRVSEELFSRPVDYLALTHSHNDHWIGAAAFDEQTTIYASEITRAETVKWCEELVKDTQNPEEWDAWVKELEALLENENDERVRVGLELSITRARYFIAEMSEFKPRYADQTFKNSISLQGSKRQAELRSFGAGHSRDDAVLLLPEDGIALIGDIGFFSQQPYMGVCDLDHWRKQLKKFQETSLHTLVPGHGTIGSQNDIEIQLGYFDVLEELITKVIQKDGSIEEAMQISLPEPFSDWLMGGMTRFKVNVRYMYKRLGGELQEEA